jgi:hypothetical protein
MEKEFVPYTLAVELKELGFDELCMAQWNDSNGFDGFGGNYRNSHFTYPDQVAAPLYQQAFSFFRDKYNLDVTFRKMDYGPESQFTGYYFSIYKGNELIDIHGADKKGKLYEDSELECLKKLIEIVK